MLTIRQIEKISRMIEQTSPPAPHHPDLNSPNEGERGVKAVVVYKVLNNGDVTLALELASNTLPPLPRENQSLSSAE